MSTYRPNHETWHDDLPAECACDPAWSDRGLVDDFCNFHRLVEAVEELREAGWGVLQSSLVEAALGGKDE